MEAVDIGNTITSIKNREERQAQFICLAHKLMVLGTAYGHRAWTTQSQENQALPKT
jgi:hypothetical protein